MTQTGDCRTLLKAACSLSTAAAPCNADTFRTGMLTMRTKMASAGDNRKLLAGTQAPTCARSRKKPSALGKLTLLTFAATSH